MKILKICLFYILCFLLLIGCLSNEKKTVNSSTQDTFSFKSDSQDERIGLSDIANDYTFPALSNDWEDWKVYKDECKETKNKNGSRIFIFRNMNVRSENGEDYVTTLNGKDIVINLEDVVKGYIGKVDIDYEELTYKDQMKFYDVQGTLASGEYYAATYFQSNCVLPSVYRKYVPTCFMIVYSNETGRTEVLNMIKDFKNNLYYEKL